MYSFSTAIIVCFNADASIKYEYNRFLSIAAINAISNIVISWVLITTIFKNMRYEGRIIGTVFPAFCLAIYICFFFFRRSRPQNNRIEIKWGLKYSLPIIPHGLSQRILSQFDQIMITNMKGAYQNGIYSFAGNISLILSVTSLSLDTVWSQWFYEQRKENRRKTIKRYSSLFMVSMLSFSISLMLIAPELTKIIGTNKYRDSIYCVFPLICGAYYTFLYTIPSAVEYYHEKTKSIAVATASAAITNIILNYIFIPKFGYIAAAYTTLITYLLYFIFHFYMAFKIEKESLFSIPVTIMCLLGELLVSIISNYLISYVAIRWIIGILLVAITFKLLEDKVGIVNIVKKRFFHKRT